MLIVMHSLDASRPMEPDAGLHKNHAASAAPIDLDYLRRYTMGNIGLEHEVLHLFSQHAPAILAELRTASSERAWRQAAHTIKGSALSLGAWRVARIAEQMEAASQRPHDWRGLLVDLELAIEEARRFIETLKRAG
jgi:HPt (histidine-containing phosphotransfer) domain-containing protein